MSIISRIAQDKEIAGLKALVKETCLDSYGETEYYEDGAGLWLVAERNGEIIGCTNISPPNGKEYPILSVLAVKPKYQNGVVGVRLLKTAERLYRWANAPGYIFGIRKDNLRMKKLSNKYATLYREDPDGIHLYYGVDFHAKQAEPAQA